MAYIQSYHFHHHDKAPNKNFGNTSHFWDLLLGTYDERYKTYKMPESSEVSLILAKKG
jgi:sterol desaturase/sphingolipid hydroxylase (fatty acid hydroxylase superfamily)